MALPPDKADWTCGRRHRSRRISDDEYEEHRPRILDLYLKQRRQREDIIKILANEDSFFISLKQLKHRLQKWGVRKNIKQVGSSYLTVQPRWPQHRICKLNLRRMGRSATEEDVDLEVLGSTVSSSQAWSNCFSDGSRYSTSSGFWDAAWSPKQVESGQETHDDLDHCMLPIVASQPDPSSSTQCMRPQTHGSSLSCLDAWSNFSFSSDGESMLHHLDVQPQIPAWDRLQLAPSTSDNDLPQFLPSGASSVEYVEDVEDVEDMKDLQRSFYALIAATSSSCAVSNRSQSILSSQADKGPALSLDSISHFDPFTSSKRLPSPLEDKDPTNITPLLLKLRSLSTKYISLQSQWGSARDSPVYLEICAVLISPWVQAALQNITCDYLQTSINWIQSPSSASVQDSVLLSARVGSDIISPSNFSSEVGATFLTDKSILPAEGALVVLNVAARENREADLVRLKVTKWSGVSCQDDTSLSMTMSYIPRASQRKLGLTLTLQRPPDISQRTALYPTLRIFGVIPCDSDTVRYTQEGDIDRLREHFYAGKAAPSDVDAEGRSLLSHAVRYRRLDTFRMLLEYGACCEEVDNGLDLVAVIWGYYVLRQAGNDLLVETKECMRMTKLALMTGADLPPYQHMVLAGLSVLDKVKKADAPTAQSVIKYIRTLHGLEWTGPTKRTPLLCSCMTNTSIAVENLLAKQANIHAQGIYGRGVLHSALYVRSYLICPDSCGSLMHESPHKCDCPFKDEPHDSHYIHSWGECPQNKSSGLGDILVRLLSNGCNPNLCDAFGKTPSEYAKRNSELWKIWTSALMQTDHIFDSLSGTYQRWQETYLVL